MGVGNRFDDNRGIPFNCGVIIPPKLFNRSFVFLYSPRMGEKSWLALNIGKYNLIAIASPFIV